MTDTGQVSAVPREHVLYVGANDPNVPARK